MCVDDHGFSEVSVSVVLYWIDSVILDSICSVGHGFKEIMLTGLPLV